MSQKERGAYYTPNLVVSTLVRWAIRSQKCRLIDPACGDGRFISQHRNSVGIELDGSAVRLARVRAPDCLIHQNDFFEWAEGTKERFDCAAGNPPFIRYQSFNGETRERALRLCKKNGALFSGLTSSWAPFLVATAGILSKGGRMAFVVPAEIGHAPYAAPVLDYLLDNFELVHVIAIREKLFPELSEDCWLLYAEGFGGSSKEIAFTILDGFRPTARPPRPHLRISASDWRGIWKRRLRPFLLPESVRELYREVAFRQDTRRFGDLASISIGYVSGGNSFFHMRPSQAAHWNIPDSFLFPTVRNGRVLPPRQLTAAKVNSWRQADDPILLLRIAKGIRVPSTVQRYLETEEGYRVRQAYKCRTRDPWYSVPDVRVPDFFLTYMSGRTPGLVRNDAGCTCTNSVHSVRVKDRTAASRLVQVWGSPLVRLSCEIEGHPLGGGLLKLEPREAAAIILPTGSMAARLPATILDESISVMQSWRHYGQA